MLKFAQARTLDYVIPIVIGNDKHRRTFPSHVCTTMLAQQLGLSGQQLPIGCGCFFDFGTDAYDLSLWMKNCLHPLTAVFFDSTGKAVHKAFMDHTNPTQLHRCPCKARYVLELHPADADAVNIGDSLQG